MPRPLACRAPCPHLLAAALGLVALFVGCGGPGAVEFVDGQCMIDGASADQAQIEARQTSLTRRMAARQPFFVVITIVVIAIGAGSAVQNAWRVVSASGGDGRAFGDRLRARLERYREHRVRYFALVGASLLLLVSAGATYVYLDLDKRAGERYLATLQFCHLALRSAEEHDQLTEQRVNLEAIQSTATSIRSLVDALPPDQQVRARVAVDSLGRALGRQSTLVGDTAKRVDATARSVAAAVSARARKPGKGAPAALPPGGATAPDTAAGAAAPGPGRLARLLERYADQLDTIDGRTSTDSARLAAIDAALRRLAEQSGCPCPACPAGPATPGSAPPRAP